MECPICYLPIGKKNKKQTLCNHYFHKKCLKNWLTIKNSCPYCRKVQKLEQKSEQKSDIRVSAWERLQNGINERRPYEGTSLTGEREIQYFTDFEIVSMSTEPDYNESMNRRIVIPIFNMR